MLYTVRMRGSLLCWVRRAGCAQYYIFN